MKQRLIDWWWSWNCKHDHQVVYQDNYVNIERCTKCGDEIRYGGR